MLKPFERTLSNTQDWSRFQGRMQRAGRPSESSPSIGCRRWAHRGPARQKTAARPPPRLVFGRKEARQAGIRSKPSTSGWQAQRARRPQGRAGQPACCRLLPQNCAYVARAASFVQQCDKSRPLRQNPRRMRPNARNRQRGPSRAGRRGRGDRSRDGPRRYR